VPNRSENDKQLTLNSFHSAGLAVQTVVSGVPRFLELLNATKELKCTTQSFYLPQYENVADIRREFGSSLVELSLKQVTKSVDILVQGSQLPDWLSWYMKIFGHERGIPHPIIELFQTTNILPPDWGAFYFHGKKDLFFQYRFCMNDFYKKLGDEISDVIFCTSPTPWCQWLFLLSPETLVHLNHLKTLQIVKEQNQGTLKLKKIQNVEKKVPKWFDFYKNYADSTLIILTHYFEQWLWPKISPIRLCGISEVKQMYFERHQDKGYTVQVVGHSLQLLAAHPLVTFSSLRTNQIWDIYFTLGIEATRQCLMEEFHKIVAGDGSFVHPSHVELLVDMMTRHGTITSMSRYGMKKESSCPLTRASFEEVMDHFLTASVFQEKEDLRGVSASIICGQRSFIGTGLCELRMASKGEDH